MKLVEAKQTEVDKWPKNTRIKGLRHFRDRGLKSYIEYVKDSDYSLSRKKFIIDYYNNCLNFYNLREQRVFDN